MLQEVIDAFRAQRLAEAEYLRKTKEIEGAVLNRSDEDLPKSLVGHDMGRRYIWCALHGYPSEPHFAAGGGGLVQGVEDPLYGQ